ncbi:MAG: phosphonate metabolism transcriptional regulator PhnF [Alphaproteobacteria bacterium]|nr:phosphonate metabolism transcriptional regulator PhnF [Alphaproteobacteria bacterium]
MRLRREAGVALWFQIAERLQEQIEKGRLRAGDQLPTEHALARDYEVNRHTARRALQALQERGLVRIEQGRGSFVREDKIDYVIGPRTRFTANLAAQNRKGTTTLLRSAETPATADAAARLGLKTGAPTIILETISHMDGVALTLGHHVFPKARFPNLVDVFIETYSITETFKTLGISDYFRERTEVTTRLPDAYEARQLDLPKGKPVLITTYTNVDKAGRPIQYSVTRFPSDRIQLVFDSSNQPVGDGD